MEVDMTMTQTELLAGIIELISKATDTEPASLKLTGALDMLYKQFKSYLSIVHDVEVIDD